MLVKHSPHWNKEINYGPDKNKIGMIVGHNFYEDPAKKVICWPIVHWEGAVMGHACHPVNIIPYRKKDLNRVQWIEMSE